MISSTEFDLKLFEQIKKINPAITLADIQNLNMQKDKESCGNSYWVSNEKIFFATVTMLENDEYPTYSDSINNGETKAYTQGLFDWERDAKTGEFQMGYISYNALDRFLFGDERIEMENVKKYEEIVNSGQDQDGFFMSLLVIKKKSLGL